MDTQKIDVKVFTVGDARPTLSELVPVFHAWIQEHRVKDELMIDVANYAHVPSGPGVMLIGHEGHYGFDLTDGNPGLLYTQRRAPEKLDFAHAVTRALRQAFRACALLEAEPTLSTPLRFRTDSWIVRVNDRLHAPNVPSTWERAAPMCRAALTPLLGEDLQLEPLPFGRTLFGFRVRPATQLSVADLAAV
jgi:hypothetical protein